MNSLTFIFLLSLTVLITHSAKSQDSYLYNKKGQLLIDTTLSINKYQYGAWIRAEDKIVEYLSETEFPPFAWENGIMPNKILIASFVCDTTTIKDIKVLNDDSGFALAVIKELQKDSKIIVEELRRSDYAYMGKYYVTINFDIIDLHTELKNRKAVPVMKKSVILR